MDELKILEEVLEVRVGDIIEYPKEALPLLTVGFKNGDSLDCSLMPGGAT